MALSIRQFLFVLLLLVTVSMSLVESFTASPPQSAHCSRRAAATKLALLVPVPTIATAAAASPMIGTTAFSSSVVQANEQILLQSWSSTTTSPALQDGVTSFMMSTPADQRLSWSSSSSLQLSLKDRVIPTAEEIAAKKFNFNVIFWGGGFIAPFLATIFYFGFRFWEK
jgi:hypothetical protein